jgi:hypothetical protein
VTEPEAVPEPLTVIHDVKLAELHWHPDMVDTEMLPLPPLADTETLLGLTV